MRCSVSFKEFTPRLISFDPNTLSLVDLIVKSKEKCEIEEDVDMFVLNGNINAMVTDISDICEGDTLRLVSRNLASEEKPKQSLKRKKIISESDEESDEESEEDEEDEESDEEEYSDEEEEEDSDEEEEEDSDEEEEEESDEEYVKDSTKGTTRESKNSGVTFEARMVDAAPPTDTSASNDMVDKIRHMLERGMHPNTPESEAVQSMRLADKMLKKHNVSQADIMASTGNVSHVDGSMYKVKLYHIPGGSACCTKQWFHTLAKTMTENFDCKSFYNVTRAECCWTFYGISTNAFSASLAFTNAFNRIAYFLYKYKVDPQDYNRKVSSGEISMSRLAFTKASKVSYCEGLAKGLLDKVREDKTDSPETTECGGSKTSASTALTTLRNRVEHDVLKKHNITINHNKRSYSQQRIMDSFVKGQHDSKKIDIQQRTLS